jgi:hypothetical protein
LHSRPWKERERRTWVLREVSRRGSPTLATGKGRGKSPHPPSVRFRGSTRSGRGRRVGLPAAVVARSLAPASSRTGIENGWRARLYWVLGEAPGASVGSGGEWSDGSTAAAHMARWRVLRRAHGGPAEEWHVRARWPTSPFVGVARRTSN